MPTESEETTAAPAGVEKKAVPNAEERASKRMMALKFSEDGRPATLAAMGDDRATLTNSERVKLEKPGPQVWRDVLENYSKNGYDSIHPDDFERFKWIGVYRQKPNEAGHFMMRIKIAGGHVSSAQLRAISKVARLYGDAIGDITTRQTIQIHWLTIENMPAVMETLDPVGLGVNHGLFGACGDICRNIVSSPLTNIEREQVIDPTSFFLEANKHFSSRPEFADLPRKYKVAIVGHRDGAQCEINDLSFYGMRRADGSTGYGLMVGGGLSTEPHLAVDLGVFVKPEEGMAVMEAVTMLFRDHGYRKNRKHARLKYLVADWGGPKFRDEIEKIIGYKLTDAESIPHSVRGYEDHYGIHPQMQEGLSYIGVPVISGRVKSDQWDAIADIADEYGSGEIRLTVMQSLYIPNIKNEDTAKVVARLNAIGFEIDVSPLHSGMVACTGTQYCNLAVTETKERGKEVVKWLDANVKFDAAEHLRVNLNGCPNSCGQHWIADIGLQGCTKKIDGELREHYDVFLGGTLGTNARFNRRIKRIIAEDVPGTIKNLTERFQSSRLEGESFADFCSRHSDDELAEMI